MERVHSRCDPDGGGCDPDGEAAIQMERVRSRCDPVWDGVIQMEMERNR